MQPEVIRERERRRKNQLTRTGVGGTRREVREDRRWDRLERKVSRFEVGKEEVDEELDVGR